MRAATDGDFEADEVLRAFATALHEGVRADSERAMDLAEAHRQHLTHWFYDCGYELHRGLAAMYVADERFMRTFDDFAPGLARFTHDAIVANAARRGH